MKREITIRDSEDGSLFAEVSSEKHPQGKRVVAVAWSYKEGEGLGFNVYHIIKGGDVMYKHKNRGRALYVLYMLAQEYEHEPEF